jgi:excisionase family DNA binding protein
MRLKEASEYTGLHPNTLRKYVDNGVLKATRLGTGRHRFIEKSELDRLMGKSQGTGVALYARVSTRKQAEAGNLSRQIERLRRYCMEHGLKVVAEVQDIASGVKENRRGLEKLLKLARRRKIDMVVVEYKDRLSRFGFKYLQDAFSSYGVEIKVLESQDKTPNEELVEDLISIITFFSARLYGRRGARKIIRTIREEAGVA